MGGTQFGGSKGIPGPTDKGFDLGPVNINPLNPMGGGGQIIRQVVGGKAGDMADPIGAKGAKGSNSGGEK